MPANSRNWVSPLIYAAWTVNLAFLLIATLWVTCDGYSPPSSEALWAAIQAKSTAVTDYDALGVRVIQGGIVAIVGSLLVIIYGMFLGPKRFRGIRAWLLVTGLVCCWCGLLASWSTLYWMGQQMRVTRCLPQAQSLVDSLNADWPLEDGEIAQLGYFMAYPKNTPSTLLFLGRANLPGTSLGLAAIERTPDSAINFELTGAEAGAWLVWCANDSVPQSFVGGLRTAYDVTRSAPLAKHWWLVRYDASYFSGNQESKEEPQQAPVD